MYLKICALILIYCAIADAGNCNSCVGGSAWKDFVVDNHKLQGVFDGAEKMTNVRLKGVPESKNVILTPDQIRREEYPPRLTLNYKGNIFYVYRDKKNKPIGVTMMNLAALAPLTVPRHDSPFNLPGSQWSRYRLQRSTSDHPFQRTGSPVSPLPGRKSFQGEGSTFSPLPGYRYFVPPGSPYHFTLPATSHQLEGSPHSKSTPTPIFIEGAPYHLGGRHTPFPKQRITPQLPPHMRQSGASTSSTAPTTRAFLSESSYKFPTTPTHQGEAGTSSKAPTSRTLQSESSFKFPTTPTHQGEASSSLQHPGSSSHKPEASSTSQLPTSPTHPPETTSLLQDPSSSTHKPEHSSLLQHPDSPTRKTEPSTSLKLQTSSTHESEASSSSQSSPTHKTEASPSFKRTTSSTHGSEASSSPQTSPTHKPENSSTSQLPTSPNHPPETTSLLQDPSSPTHKPEPSSLLQHPDSPTHKTEPSP